MKKKLLTLFLAICMICTLLPFSALADNATSGKCGDNVTWSFENGTLTISGKGVMNDYDDATCTPWHSNIDDIINVVIKSGVRSIGDYAFSNCTNLTSITTPDSVTSIGECAFMNCTSLTSITISANVERIGILALEYCEQLKAINVDKGNKNYLSIDGILFNKDITELVRYPEAKTGKYVIPDSVNEIGWCAFTGCNGLTELTIPNSISKIDDHTFNSCTNLKKVTIPDSVTYIGWDSFMFCSSLESVTIPNSVTTICDQAFEGCSSLTTVTIPNSITELNIYVFAGCTELKSVTIPNSVTRIARSAFAYCEKLKSVTIPYSVKSVGESAFAGCRSLTDVYYLETENNWNNISIDKTENECILNAKVHFSGHSTELKKVKAESCTADGYTGDKVCKTCGKTIEKGKDLAALGHSWDAGKITTKATCTEKGAKTYTCAVCGATKTESIAALGHKTELKNTKEATCAAKGYTGDKVCKTCGKTIEKGKDVAALGHSWDAGKITIKATCTEKGVKTYTCKVCSATKTESIATISHNYKNGKCTVCGAKDPNYKPVTKNPFVDVSKSSYCYEPVLWAYNHDPQVTAGVDKTHFAPDNNCTRAQIVTFLWRAKGCPEVKGAKNPFKDVKSSDYYYDAVLWAVSKNITTGIDATHFAPNNTCTRGQAVTFLWRANENPKPASTKCPFNDVKTSDYYYNAVLWAVGKNITNGVDKTHFAPNNTCTRGQIVTFLYRDMK